MNLDAKLTVFFLFESFEPPPLLLLGPENMISALDRIYVVGYRKSKKALSGTGSGFSVTAILLVNQKSVCLKYLFTSNKLPIC
jgi:hypothetical protein